MFDRYKYWNRESIEFHNSEYGSWFQIDNIDKDKKEPCRITQIVNPSWDESGESGIVNRNEIEITDWWMKWYSLEWTFSYGISTKYKSGIVNRNEIEIMRVRLSWTVNEIENHVYEISELRT